MRRWPDTIILLLVGLSLAGVVIGARARGGLQAVELRAGDLLTRLTAAPPAALAETDRYGFADVIVDPDGVVRRIPLFLDDGDRFETALRPAVGRGGRSAGAPRPARPSPGGGGDAGGDAGRAAAHDPVRGPP